MIHSIIKHAIEIEADILLRMEDACSDADLIIPVFMHAIDGHTLACEKNIPEIHILLFPIFTPTGAYPDMVLPD
jgi:hypothetical protein